MIKNLFLGVLLLFTHISFAQNNDKWRAGSANVLKGKVYILSVFIATLENDWVVGEKLKIFEIQREACRWIQIQAQKYEQEVSFEEGTFGYEQSMMFQTLPTGTGSGNEEVDWVSRVLKKAGYKNALDFTNWVKNNTTCTQSIVLIYMNTHGTSYALPASIEMSKEIYFNEYNCCPHFHKFEK